MGKTIKEISEEIGVSKQAIFKRIKKEPLSTSLQGLMSKVDGRLIVSVDGEKLIKSAFSSDFVPDEVSTVDSGCRELVDCEVDAKNDEIIFLRAQVERLEVELEKEREHNRQKDKQLLDTLNRLAESQAALSVGQAADKQKALAEKIIEGKKEVDNNKKENKVSFFSRFFRK